MAMYMSYDPSAKYFSPKVSARERAAFEAGIAIGMAVHQFTGIPVRRKEDLRLLEKVIENAIKSQPFKIDAEVKIDAPLEESGSPFAYTTLKARHMDITVVVKYEGAVVRARIRYIPELDYNLAYIEDITEES